MKILSKLNNTGMIEEVADKRYVTDTEKSTWNGKADKTYVDNKVKTDVPVGAKFTDTVYTHPATHPASMITGLPTSLPANGGNADTVDGKHASDFANIDGVSTSWKVGNITHNTARCLFTGTTTEILIKTKIPFSSGAHMPVIHIQGYAYGLQSPIELKIGYYVYDGKHGWCGAVSMGAWQPEIKLFSYIGDDNEKYTGVALLGRIYFPQFSVGVQIEHGMNYARDWTVTSNMSNNTVYHMPNSDVVNVPYKSTFSSKINGVTFDGLSDITITANPNPHTHPASMITESSTRRFVSDTEKATWNSKSDTDTVTTINGKTGAITKADIVALGIPAQDTVVDISGKADKTYVDNKVKTNVPVGAKFTDTITTINGKTGAISKADIVALGIPAQDTTYSEITTDEIDAGNGVTVRSITARRLKYLSDKIIALFPTKTSDLTNDSGFLTRWPTWSEVTGKPTVIDYNASGKGMAIGKVSESDSFEVGMPTHISSTFSVEGVPYNNSVLTTRGVTPSDISKITQAGIYSIGGTYSNFIGSGTYYGYLTVKRRFWNTDEYLDYTFTNSAGDTWVAGKWANVMSSWSQQWSARNSDVIIDSGSNPNGRYIRFSDGTQICWHRPSFNATYNPWGNLYSYDHRTKIPFPADFIERPRVSVVNTHSSAGMIAVVTADTTGLTQVSLVRPNVSNTIHYVDYIAIGRWK